MWLKLCLLLLYIALLFVLSRMLDAIAWCESGSGGAFSRQLLDPMLLSVAKLKALLEQRGVSYEGVVEKSELTSLVDASGQVSAEDVKLAGMESPASVETNFTSGAHFIEQVEDAKDSVWLVQVVTHTEQIHIVGDIRWKTIREKASKFGVRTGFLDCSLDVGYCFQKGWRSPFLLLALPDQFEKKASITTYNYSGPVKENAVFRWMRDKLDQRVVRIREPLTFQQNWQNFASSPLDPEIRAVLFTQSTSAPLFFSALSVKFPGRVKFGLVCLKSPEIKYTLWKHIMGKDKIARLPAYVIYSAEKNYTYGMQPGELFSFHRMELFLKFLYPCLNDIFIVSFCIANVMSWFELFISNCPIFKRIRKFIWCVFKYNIVMIMLWLPIIGLFQMPYLDRVPLAFLKLERIISTSYLGSIIRGDYVFFLSNPAVVYMSFIVYVLLVTVLCNKYRQREEDGENWFNFYQPLTHLRQNAFIFEPMSITGNNLMGRLEIFGSHLAQPSLWLQPSIPLDYIQRLPTWRYMPVPLSIQIAQNITQVRADKVTSSSSIQETKAVSCSSTGEERASKGEILSDRKQETCSAQQAQISEVKGSRNPDSNVVHAHFKPVEGGPSSFRPAVLSEGAPHESAGSGKKAELQPSPQSDVSVNNERTHVHQPRVEYSDQAVSLGANHSSKSTSTPPLQTLSETSGTSISNLQSVESNSEESQVGNNSALQMLSPESPALHTHFPAAGASSLLRMRPSGFPLGFLESHQCVICLDEYVVNTMLCGLPCGHVFHEHCIISWLNREKHFCPMCRWPAYKLHPSPTPSQSMLR